MALNSNQCVTGKVRFSYVHLAKPYAREQGQDPRYSVTILLPKTDTASKQRIDAAINAAKQRGSTEKWGGMPPRIAIPIYDGDGTRPSDGMPFGSECKGHYVFTASAREDRPPQLLDASGNPIITLTDLYSGMYGRAILSFFPYNAAGKKGIGVGLEAVQKLADGQSLGSSVDAASEFAAAGDMSSGGIDPITGMPL